MFQRFWQAQAQRVAERTLPGLAGRTWASTLMSRFRRGPSFGGARRSFAQWKSEGGGGIPYSWRNDLKAVTIFSAVGIPLPWYVWVYKKNRYDELTSQPDFDPKKAWDKMDAVLRVYLRQDPAYDTKWIPDDMSSWALTAGVDPETGHNLAVWALGMPEWFRRLFVHVEDPANRMMCSSWLETNFCGMQLENCLGLAAGFDKHCEAAVGSLDLGFGFVEIGSVTPKPQAGNPKPRVFRLVQERAVINRYGFNSDGHDRVERRLARVRKEEALLERGWHLGVNLGKNKKSDDAVGDYRAGVRKLGPYADYLVVNVSSPNTPGLRDLQGEKELRALLTAVLKERQRLPPRKEKWFKGRPDRPPLLVKIAPDVDPEGLVSIARVVEEVGIDGVIVSNTTVRRDFGFEHVNLKEGGGLSGRPLRELSTKTIFDFYKLTGGRVPIIGVGGVESGRDAFEKISAGATAVQMYTGLIYNGPGTATKIKRELCEILVEKEFTSISEAVGSAHKGTQGGANPSPKNNLFVVSD